MRQMLVIVILGFVVPVPGQSQDELRDQLLGRINAVRAKGKVAALARNAKLDAAAQKHVANMARQEKYGDDGKNGHMMDGKGPRDRLDAEAYARTWTGENVAFIGGGSAKMALDMVVNGWSESPGHYKNIMNDVFDETGIGVAQSKSGKWYFCQTFGKSARRK
jgi:uncharacterized protein YkwD